MMDNNKHLGNDQVSPQAAIRLELVKDFDVVTRRITDETVDDPRYRRLASSPDAHDSPTVWT